MTIHIGSPELSSLDADLLAELRSDHAGEYGAVVIYNGILAVTRSAEIRRFACEHRVTEQKHLQFMEAVLPPHQRTRLLPLWGLMAWALGALPALFGPRAVYHTIDAVESFVEGHYQRQIAMLRGRPELDGLRQTLERFCAEESTHGRDARGRSRGRAGILARCWKAVVGGGSAAAVALAKRY